METVSLVKSSAFTRVARKAFKEAFKGCTSAAVIDNSVRLPVDDPGKWSPNSLLVVYKESGIPDKYYYPQFQSNWKRVEDKLSAFLGKNVFFEEINGAVSALYWG